MEELIYSVKEKRKDINIHFKSIEYIHEIIKMSDYSGIFIVTDENVYNEYKSEIECIENRWDAKVRVLKPGEQSKDINILVQLFGDMKEYGMKRDGVIIALGGGVIGDISGLAASLYLRGIAVVGVPTTVLAQVDSSVGGKTAVNFDNEKNRIGTFYQPQNVIIDIELLKSLNRREFQNGCAEIIKYGCILDENLFNRCCEECVVDLIQSDRVSLEKIIRRCIELKIDVVCEDELDKGIRNILNFGHTIGHYLESSQGLGNIKHGEAVALGMYYITLWSEKCGYTVEGTAKKIKEVLLKNELIRDVRDISKKDMVHAIMKDKKAHKNGVKLVLLKKIGECFIKEAHFNDIEDMAGFVYEELKNN